MIPISSRLAAEDRRLTMSIDCAEYPDLLRSIPDPPAVLYGRGQWPDRTPALAFVGSRRPSAYGRRMAYSLAREAARAGFAVVSGLALGIDAEAHAAALEAGAKTWAVLGSGLDCVYPRENKALAENIIKSGGCLLSEFPEGTPPLAMNFPRRNRIVSGLCWGVVVIEGRDRSGSLITARLALSQGREVFAVPGPADSALSQAPHILMRAGARPVICLADILEDMPPAIQARAQKPPSAPASSARAGAVPLDPVEAKVLELIGSEERGLEEIAQDSGLAVAELSCVLFHMELEDLIQSLPGQRYAKKSG
ncbi:MAG: DNA-processing protein DprA [Elusimicrobiota bacterium]